MLHTLFVMTKYFSQRTGDPNGNSLSDFSSRFFVIFSDFVDMGYFRGVRTFRESPKLSYEVNIDWLEKQLILTFGAKGSRMTPTRTNITNLDQNSLFDLIEFLSKEVSIPGGEYYVGKHGDNYYEPDDGFEDGWGKWRDTLNEQLAHLDPPYKLTTDRNIETVSTLEGLHNLVDNYESPSKGDQEKIKYACKLFLKHRATQGDKCSALKHLADILELMRDDLKKFISSEENELFNIANRYGIRHYKDQNKCDENYQQWIFYSFLATIDLMAKLKTQKL